MNPGRNVCHEPPSARAIPTRSNRKPNALHVATPPFHDSAVAMGFQIRCEPASTIGSVAGLPSSQTRQTPGRRFISSTASRWLSPTCTFCTRGRKTGSPPGRVISAYTIVGVFGRAAIPTCSHMVWPFAPALGPPTPIHAAAWPALTDGARSAVIVARTPLDTRADSRPA